MTRMRPLPIMPTPGHKRIALRTSAYHQLRQLLRSGVSAALLILNLITMVMVQEPERVLASNAPDQISGQVTGSGAVGIVVSLEAWGARPVANLIEFIAVGNARTDNSGRFSFAVSRAVGQAATHNANLSFRGWAVKVNVAQCGQLELRPPAQRLRDNCEAGWLIRPWQAQPLQVSDALIFSLLTASPPTAPTNSAGNDQAQTTSATPLTQDTATPYPLATPDATTDNQVTPQATNTIAIIAPPPPNTPPANSNQPPSPVATPPPALPSPEPNAMLTATGISAEPPPPSVTPLLTAVAAPSATVAPFIIDIQAPINAPTAASSNGAARGGAASSNPTATPGLAVALAPPPQNSPPPDTTHPHDNGWGLLQWTIAGLIIFIVLMILIRIVNWLRAGRQHREELTYNQSAAPYSYSSPSVVDNYGAANDAADDASFHLPPPDARYEPTPQNPAAPSSRA